MASEGHIQPLIVLTKTDLIAPEDLERKIAAIRHDGISAEIVAISNRTGFGVDDFRRLLVPGKTFCLLGSSGVGKTTLINRCSGRTSSTRGRSAAPGKGCTRPPAASCSSSIRVPC